jgi:hypothetical protein
MNFNQDRISMDQVIKSLEALINDGNFPADAVIFDGYNITDESRSDLETIREFARRLKLEIWFSLSLQEEQKELYNEKNIPIVLEKLIDNVDVLINLRHSGDYVHLQITKDHEIIENREIALRLDPKTLLIAEE